MHFEVRACGRIDQGGLFYSHMFLAQLEGSTEVNTWFLLVENGLKTDVVKGGRGVIVVCMRRPAPPLTFAR